MGKANTGGLIVGALKSLCIAIFKLCAIVLAWTCRLIGLFLSKFGETLEKILVKRH